MITNSFIFNPTTTWLDVGVIEIMDDSLLEEQKEFNISISGIEAIEAPDANLATPLGGPVTIIVYDNDYEYPSRVEILLQLLLFLLYLYLLVEIGFTEDSTDIIVREGSSTDVCVAILKPETRSNIHPAQAILITIMLENATSSGKL